MTSTLPPLAADTALAAPPFTLLGRDAAQLRQRHALATAQEIAQQPAVWRRIQRDHVPGRGADVHAFLQPLLADPRLRIVLTGAGTSAFVGELLQPRLSLCLQARVEAIATTELVAAPDRLLQPGVPTLLVSFARSGSSPESVAAVDLADTLLQRCHHLVVTCNAEGALAQQLAGHPRAHVMLLPPETHDRGFAMTSSFTGMVLAAALAFNLLQPDSERIEQLAESAQGLLDRADTWLKPLAASPFNRVVWLGSGGLRGLAREAALKLLELTRGRIIATSESTLGFRHGPKTILNRQTLAVVLLSPDPHTRRYDLDLLRELRADGQAGAVWCVDPTAGATTSADHLALGLPEDVHEIEAALPMAVMAQLLALQQSLSLGLTPDNPDPTGAVTRVVHGVTIHPWTPADRPGAHDVPGR